MAAVLLNNIAFNRVRQAKDGTVLVWVSPPFAAALGLQVVEWQGPRAWVKLTEFERKSRDGSVRPNPQLAPEAREIGISLWSWYAGGTPIGVVVGPGGSPGAWAAVVVAAFYVLCTILGGAVELAKLIFWPPGPRGAGACKAKQEYQRAEAEFRTTR